MKRVACILSVLVLARLSIAEVGTLYIKNNADVRMDVWVDDQYQGYVPAGKTAYIVSEGFVTSDGANESHGGWTSKGGITVRLQTGDEDKALVTKVDVEGDGEKKAYVWAECFFGGESNQQCRY